MWNAWNVAKLAFLRLFWRRNYSLSRYFPNSLRYGFNKVMQVLGMCFVTSGTAKRETNQPRGLVGFSNRRGDAAEFPQEEKRLFNILLSTHEKRAVSNI